MSSKDRQAVVTRIRAEGAKAFKDGISIKSCPYQGMNAMQWRTGYRDADDEEQECQS